MSKHTPGPWRLKKDGNIGNAVEARCGDWEYGERWSVVCTYQQAIPYVPGNHLEERENMTANGHLIAAAPELYEALMNLATRCSLDSSGRYLDLVGAAMDALAKAESEQ